ncbi:MAG: hypothetical protein A3F83_10385 [Candidatus Glassbacteria bacterium RIFCSPLOWO2_12_FULL_58_11]|uniref:Uncharacterized protein n=1 Tax=Candidatus Glassbacteria bacterium RIFCSPLOWO2_12_FULL_58_11 TaxID=1817867 RepID=A0A1F5YKB1_9BACT|nr:MAG: hypothetical protein A3F83_10385 [Candidatus Glassbacteria bacterium RIFCSPLOWO2_12_FULL_58_11]
MSVEKEKKRLNPKGKKPANIKLTKEENKKLEAFIFAPVRSADRLLKNLYNDDSFYETATYARVDEKDAKKLFFYGVCKEVGKACIALINEKEFLQEVPAEIDPEPIGKIITGSIYDIQTYRIRKMVELLSILILFDKNCQKDEEYRIYLNAENMDLALSRQEDFRELHESRIIFNIQSSIDDFADRIKQDMLNLGVTELWFLDNIKFKKKKPSVFKAKKKLFLDALLVANADERFALGISYGRGYSRTSQCVHPLLGSHDYGKDYNTTKQIITNITYLSTICMHIMHLAYKIVGIIDPGGITKALGAKFEKSKASKLLEPMSKDFQLGDIVLTAWNELAKIMEEHKSKYGYKAYKVRYLSKPPLPEFPEDWIEAQNIIGTLMSKNMVRSFYEKFAQSLTHENEVGEAVKEVLKLPDEELFRYAEKAFLDFHNKGRLISMLLKAGFLKEKQEVDFS